MNPLTMEWLIKAEGDLSTARREFRVRKSPNYDAICFHAQQAAEKYLKAVPQENGIVIPRSHSLAELLALLAKNNVDLMKVQANAVELEGYAIQFRYPGLFADKTDAKLALRAANQISVCIGNLLGLSRD